MWDGHFGGFNVAKHRFELSPVDAKRIQSLLYKASPKACEFDRIKVNKMLSRKVIEPALAEWAEAIVFVPKKDGSLRFCAHYRKLNAVAKQNVYAIPRRHEYIESLGKDAVFCTLEKNSGY